MGGSVGNSISNALEDAKDFVTDDTRRDEKRSLAAASARAGAEQERQRVAKQEDYDRKKIDRARLYATAGGGAGQLTSAANTGRKQFFGQ